MLCDIWGFLDNGVAAFADAMCMFRAQGGIVILSTNAPRSSRDIYSQLARLGVPRAAFDTILTSGDVTGLLLQKQPETPFFHFGPARDQSILQSLSNPIVGGRNTPLRLLTGPLDDEIESAEIYDPLLTQMRENAVDMIYANPNLFVKSGNRMVICAGSIARFYVRLGGRVTYVSKPEAPIHDAALSQMTIAAGGKILKTRVQVIDDGLLTDIKGAARNGFDACFLAGGIHSGDMGV